jgi:CRP-like cAMP-binding protein
VIGDSEATRTRHGHTTESVRPPNMPLFSNLPRDAAATRARRAAILARTPLTASLSGGESEKLLADSALATCPANTVLFTAGDPPKKIFLIGSGSVQIRVQAGSLADDRAEPAMHLCLLGAGEVVADRELAQLAAGVAGEATRRSAAIVLGTPAEILAIDQHALAGVLAGNPMFRARLADALVARIEALEALADELAALKNFGKVRLARLLLQFFDFLGQPRGGVLRLAQVFTQGELAAMLGLTRRSVGDDIAALEAFDAIGQDPKGHLKLRDRARLRRIASLDPADREASAAAWREDVAAALAEGDTLRAFELAREALLYHPKDAGLGYSATLAALRAGALEAAEALISSFRFSATDDDERRAALQARVLKARAFAAPDPAALRDFALRSAQAYELVYHATRGRYSWVNAASMFYVAGEVQRGEAIARALSEGAAHAGLDYWSLATRAEALWLLGHHDAAAGFLGQAAGAEDADDGKMATTRRQFSMLSHCLRRDASDVTSVLPVRKTLVCMQPPRGEQAAALARSGWAGAFLAIGDAADLAAYGPLAEQEGISLVLAAPAEILLRTTPAATAILARRECHVAQSASARVSPADIVHARRRALGLGLLAAEAQGADVMVVPEGVWPEGDVLAPGQSAVLWVQAADDASLAGLAGSDHLLAGNTIIVVRRSLDAALAYASGLRGRPLRMCLDVENLSGVAPVDIALARMQPLTRPGDVFATEAAAAELALLRRPDLRLIAVGRLRAQRRMEGVRGWAVQDVLF